MKIVRVVSFASVLALAPLAWSADRGLYTAEACGFAECCPEKGSTCVKDDKVTEDEYYTSKSCPPSGGEEEVGTGSPSLQ